MSYENRLYYKPGRWNVHCDVCGFKFKSDEVKKRWDGLYVCNADYELDHPQKYLRVAEDRQVVPFVRKQNDDTFGVVCYLWDRSGYADLMAADCGRVENTTYTFSFLFAQKNEVSG